MSSYVRRAVSVMALSIAIATVTAPVAFAGRTTGYLGPYPTQEACEADRPNHAVWPDTYTFPCEYYASPPNGSGSGAGWYFKFVTVWD